MVAGEQPRVYTSARWLKVGCITGSYGDVRGTTSKCRVPDTPTQRERKGFLVSPGNSANASQLELLERRTV